MKKALRIMAVVMAIVMVMSLCACGENDPKPTKKQHDQLTHMLEDGSGTTYHDFVDGKCTRCGETTIFRQDPMYKSTDITTYQSSKPGKVEALWYNTEAFCVEGKWSAANNNDTTWDGKLWIRKRAFVYTPGNYDPNKNYNVLFMMHGDKLNEGYWFANGFYKPTDSNFTNGYFTTNMLDYMYDNNMIEDTIFVGMTMYEYYGGTAGPDDDHPVYTGNDSEQDNAYSGYPIPNPNVEGATLETEFPWYMKKGKDYEGADTYWHLEFMNGLYPAIIENYNVYAKSTSEEDLIAARDHVGITGLSRGGGSVRVVAENCLEYVSWFAHESAGCPSDAAVANFKAKKDKYPVNYVFISSGSEEGPVGGDASMLKVRDAMGWSEGSDLKGGDKICYITVNGTAHNYATWITNLYNLMLVFFKK